MIQTETTPKPKSFTLKLGDGFFVSLTGPEGRAILPSEMWTVIEITRTHVTLTSNSGDRYRLLR